MKQLTGDDMRYKSDDTLGLEVGQKWETYGGEIVTIVGYYHKTKVHSPNYWTAYVETDATSGSYSVTAKGRFWEGEEGFTDADSEDNLKRRITIDERPELFL